MKAQLRGAQGCAVLLALLFLGSAAGELPAAPFIPDADAEVLETLPRALDDHLAPLREASAQRPEALAPALRFARAAIESGRASGDPRYFGQAEARLAPFLASDTDSSSPELHLLWALFLEQRHEFPAALDELAAVLRLRPHDAQAHFTRSVIHTVQARYPEALADCDALAGHVSALIETACRAAPQSLRGGAAAAYADLDAALHTAPYAPTSERGYTQAVLAEIAERLGRDADAERHYRAALHLGSNPPLLAAYADLLLRRQRHGEVLALIAADTPADALLLRRVLALRHADPTAAEREARLLDERFAAARRRDDFAHQREAALFQLEVRGEARQALALARENWRTQREPFDARLLVAAANAAGDHAALREVLDALAVQGTEDALLPAFDTQREAAR